MITIEHQFDVTTITILDEEGNHDDLIVEFDEHSVLFRQWSDQNEDYDLIEISEEQFRSLIAALDLPEGAYR
jgi:hypothetical protein